MKNYLKMKKSEWKIKKMFYGLILEFTENQKDILNLIQNLYLALKDAPLEELRHEVVRQIAELAHEQAVKDSSSGK